MVTHSFILEWRIPQTAKPGGLQSMGHKELDMTAQLYTHCLVMPTSIVSWIHHTTSYPGNFAQVFTLLEGSNSSSACLCSPYPSFKTKLKHLSGKIFLIPTLSPLCQQTWLQVEGPGRKSKDLAHSVHSKEVIIVLSNSWSWPGFFSSLWQLDQVLCEKLEINYAVVKPLIGSKILGCSNVSYVSYMLCNGAGGPHYEHRFGGYFWYMSTSAAFPLGYHTSQPQHSSWSRTGT